MSLDDKIMGGIPLAEAASFFIRVKTGAALDHSLEEKTTAVVPYNKEASARFSKAAAEMTAALSQAMQSATPIEQQQLQPGGVEEPLPPIQQPNIGPEVSALQEEERQLQAMQEQHEAVFYQQKAQASQQQAEMLQQQVSQLSQQVQTTQQQLDQSQQAIQTAMQQAQMAQAAAMANVQQAHDYAGEQTQKAIQSMSEVLKQKQLAAAMRMGAVQLKDQVMGVLANDPTEALAQQLQSPPPGSGGGMEQQASAPGAVGQGMEAQGPAAAAPQPQGAPGAMPPQGNDGAEGASAPAPTETETEKKPAQQAGSKTTINVSSAGKDSKEAHVKYASFLSNLNLGERLPYAAGGAAAGALAGNVYAHSGNEHLRSKIQELEAAPEDSLGHAISLAQAKARLAFGEAAEQHPGAATAVGAVMGGIGAGMHGPAIKKNIVEGKKNFDASKNLEQKAKQMGLLVG